MKLLKCNMFCEWCSFVLILLATGICGNLNQIWIFFKIFLSNFRIFIFFIFHRFLISSLVHADEFNNIQQNDDLSQVDGGRGLPTVPSSMPNENLPIGSGEKATLYLGTFQILAMPFSPGHIPPNFGNIGTIAPPSKKD